MSDWYGSARSNYFKVKDVENFKGLCNRWNVTSIENNEFEDKQNRVGFICESDFGGLPSGLYEEIDGEERELDFDDFLKELSEQLVDGEVAIMMEAGAEKLRYITGFAIAINSKNEQRTVNLSNIYEIAKELGSGITAAEY